VQNFKHICESNAHIVRSWTRRKYLRTYTYYFSANYNANLYINIHIYNVLLIEFVSNGTGAYEKDAPKCRRNSLRCMVKYV